MNDHNFYNSRNKNSEKQWKATKFSKNYNNFFGLLYPLSVNILYHFLKREGHIKKQILKVYEKYLNFLGEEFSLIADFFLMLWFERKN